MTKKNPHALPSLPTLEASLPVLPKPGALPVMTAIPKPKTIAELALEQVNPLDRNNELYINDAEHDANLDVGVIADEFKAIRDARAKQAAAVELANDSEYWFAVYFQTREQKEAFVKAVGLVQDKYIDGLQLAAALKIALPPRPAPYKVGKVDRKLSELT